MAIEGNSALFSDFLSHRVSLGRALILLSFIYVGEGCQDRMEDTHADLNSPRNDNGFLPDFEV